MKDSHRTTQMKHVQEDCNLDEIDCKTDIIFYGTDGRYGWAIT